MAIEDQYPVMAFLGPAGTYSDEVVTGCLNWKRDCTVACNNLEEVCRGISKKHWQKGLLPAENSLEGPVGQTMDLLINYETLKICREILLSVKHCLLAPEGVNPEQIGIVLSHTQALGQCRGYLEKKLPRAVLREAASTAHAAREVAEKGAPRAALASKAAASTYGLKVLDSDINDGSENVTRFFMVSEEEIDDGGECKTTIIFTIRDRPGALYSILGEFASRGINLTRIESRPMKKKLGEYVFFIDFTGHRLDSKVRDVLDEVKKKCNTFRVAGSYSSISFAAGSPL